MKSRGKITDNDAIEIASGWTYYDKAYPSTMPLVNGKRYKVLEYEKNTKTGLGYKIFERYENNKATGDIILTFEGTDFSSMQDVITDLQLAGNNIPAQLKEAREVYFGLKQKYADANTMSTEQFKLKYGEPPNDYKGKSIQKVGGNSLAGAEAQYIGILDPNVGVVTTNTAPLPMSIAKLARKNANNIHNYHSKSDILTMIIKGAFMYDRIVGKHIYIDNGVTTFGALTPSHTGYNFEEIKKLNKFDQDNIVNKEVCISRNGLKIYADMDVHTPIFIWSGDAVAAGVTQIKLDKGHLAELSSYVHTRLTDYIKQIDAKMEDIKQSVEDEHRKFEQFVDETKVFFKEITKFNELESTIHIVSDVIKFKINRKADELKYSLTKLKNEDNILDFIGADHIINSIIDFIDDVKSKVSDFITYGEKLIEGLLNIVNNSIVKMFVNPVNGYMDGVREEILAHLNIVIPNIQIVKNQIMNFGKGIDDILQQMSNLDDNVMVNQVEINKNATKQPAFSLEESKYLPTDLEIVENTVESAIVNLLTAITFYILPIVEVFMKIIAALCAFGSLLSTFIDKIEWIASKIPFANSVAEDLSSFQSVLNYLIKEVNNFSLIISKFLTVEFIGFEMREFFINMVLSKSLLEDIKILSSSAEGNAEMLGTELQAILTALAQNKGKSVDALKNSTKSLTQNISRLKEQLDKTAH